MRSKTSMIARIVADTFQIASAAPPRIQKVCWPPSTFVTVSSTTWKAGGDIASRALGAHSWVHCSSRPSPPSTPSPKSASGMIA